MSDAAAPPPAAPGLFVMPVPRALCYIFASFLLGISQGLGMSLLSSNITQVQGEIGATQQEALWLIAAYMAPSASVTLALIKIRTQFGLRLFAQVALTAFVLASLLNLAVTDLHSGIAVRFMSGLAAAPMSTLAFLYMLEPFPAARKLSVGLSLALTGISLGTPLSRVLAPHLLDLGGLQQLNLLDLALALLGFAVVLLLPLTPVPRQKVIERADLISFPLIAIGMGALAVVLTVGTSHWWFDTPWLGTLVALAIVTLVIAATIELHRKDPLIDVRWLASPAILQLTGALIVFRIVLAEQTSGAPGFYIALGLQNQQMQGMFWMIVAVTILGGLVSAVILKPGREAAIHSAALIMIVVGALIDSHTTSLTRPAQMMFSQGLIAFASAIFLPAAMASGLMTALRRGPLYILSFVIVFLTTQRLGGIAGSALFQTVIRFRQNAHLSELEASLSQADPLVTARLQTYAAIYNGQMAEAAARQSQALTTLSQVVTRESTVMAYNDVFFLIACVAGAALAVLAVHQGWLWMQARRAQPSSNG
ncbi:MFS transporter [Falsirhodobacter algicola]|uniref:MFS transporter n=1 Tax=Falsirhodobacter algicola TaxID=2692330 RepID=A0A8J8SK66_9RHOB|nr:MFS transporter [Falsirhodobacter algicola]QUS35037.1 MFS transporter [Falsirhodobacter algicola]